tara:strand:+ start:965 stop:1579 length:615 start_codon:yes stop_codon:yes gene_type:complete
MADLSDDLTTILNDVDLENFQNINFERFGLKLDPGSAGTLDTVKMAIEKVYSDALKAGLKEGPYQATCLLSYVDPTGTVPMMGKFCRAADPRPIIKVIAKPHGLFPDLPVPCITDPEALKTEKGIQDRMIYAMYPVFYAESPDMVFPNPGDKIEVDFEDQKNMVFGKYLKFLRKAIGSSRSICEPAKDLFSKSENTAQPLGSNG